LLENISERYKLGGIDLEMKLRVP